MSTLRNGDGFVQTHHAPWLILLHAIRESQGDSILQPRVTRNALPWVNVRQSSQPQRGCGASHRSSVCKRAFELRHTRFQRLDGFSHLFLSVTRGDELRAVPVEAHHVDQEEALDFSTEVGRGCQPYESGLVE